MGRRGKKEIVIYKTKDVNVTTVLRSDLLSRL